MAADNNKRNRKLIGIDDAGRNDDRKRKNKKGI